MNRLSQFASTCLSLSLLFSCSHKQKSPNIVFILADDLGYSEVNFFANYLTGTPTDQQYYETPNIDKLAQKGISFTQAYACPLCSPTRASILTGKYAAKLGFSTATGGNAKTFYNQGQTPPNGFHEQQSLWADAITYPQKLKNGYTQTALLSGQPQDHGIDEITLAEALKGYHSAFIGKWHLGGHGSEGYQPEDQGFHALAWLDEGSSPFFKWQNAWNNKIKKFPLMRQEFNKRGDAGERSTNDYLTDDLTTQAVRFIEGRKNQNEPFFLYFCHFAVHAPLQAHKEDIDHFESKKTKGWNGHNNATYAAMIKSLDNSVGSIVSALKANDLDENTIIVFVSDNGGVSWPMQKYLCYLKCTT